MRKSKPEKAKRPRGRPLGAPNEKILDKDELIEKKLKHIQNKVLKELQRRTMNIGEMTLEDMTKVLRACRDGLNAAAAAKQGKWGEAESSIRFVSYMAGRAHGKDQGHQPAEPEETSTEDSEVGLQADAEAVGSTYSE